jgi:uncharacterized membrane protein
MKASGDTRLEVLIGRVLRIGVTISSVFLGAGLAVALARPGAGSVLMNIGIVVLICTPGARVVLSFVEYLLDRDWQFVVLTGVVLLELVAGAVAAIVFHTRI